MTGSSVSGSTPPILINTLTSQITHHGGVTLVNSPAGVTMAWEAPVNMNGAETSRYMGLNNLRHDVSTDHVIGETTSVASTEFTHEEYEAYRNSRQGRGLELPPQPPEQQGNTQGTVTFAPGPGTRAEYATPPPEEPSPETTETQPNEQLQALIDNANDDRSLWERAQDGAASAWDGTKRIATASWENPGEFGKGVAKGIGNLPSDIANLAVEGIKSGGGFNPFSLNNYAKLLDYQAMNAYQAGNIATANTMASHANSIREFGQVGDIFELTNDAQKGGSFASIFIPLGTLVKVGAGATKLQKVTKTAETVADTTKAADTASDVANVPAPKGPNRAGTGGKVKATPKMKQHKPKCFKPGKALKDKYKDDPKEMEKEFYKQLKAQEDGINKMTVGEYTKNRGILNDLTAKHGHEKARELLTQGGKAQEAARKQLASKIKKSITDSLRDRGIKGSQADKIATEQTQKQMSQLAALHDPDLIAGGNDTISRVGNKNVNSSLGSQWAKDGRVDGMDKAAGKAMAESGPDTPMNVELERCKD